MQKSFKFRIYPNPEQKIMFAKTFGCSRFIWNKMLADRIKYYKETTKSLHNTPAQYKQEFSLMDPESICKGSTLNGYEKYILDDKNRLTVGLHCPIHVNGAGAYNYILNQPKNKKYRVKYNTIKTGDKIKFYKTTNAQLPVFSFLPNSFPLEIAPPIDINQQFTDLVLEPINRIIVAIGHKELSPTLTYTKALF